MNVVRGVIPPCISRCGLFDRQCSWVGLGDSGFAGYRAWAGRVGGALRLVDGAIRTVWAVIVLLLGSFRAIGRLSRVRWQEGAGGE